MKQAGKDKALRRYIVIFVMMLLAGLYILAKALYTMLPPESDYWKAVGLNSKTAKIPANRGNILSCDRQVLSGTVPERTCRSQERMLPRLAGIWAVLLLRPTSFQ